MFEDEGGKVRATLGQGEVLTATPSAQGIGKHVSAGKAGDRYPFQRPLSNRHIIVPDSRLTTVANNAAGMTDRAAWVCRSKPYKVRLLFANQMAATMTIDSVKVACSATLDNKLNPASSAEWVSDNTDIVIAAAVVANSQPTLGASAWIDVTGVEMTDNPGLYYITTSAFAPVAQTNLSKQYGAVGWRESQDINSGLWWATRSQNGDAHTDPTAFTSTSGAGRVFIIGIEAICEEGSVIVMSNGDSITAGSGGTNYTENDIWLAVRELNLAGARISFVNNGWGTQASADYTARCAVSLSFYKPDVLILGSGTPNDGEPTAAVINALQRRISTTIEAARAAGCERVILRGWAPTSLSNWSAANDNNRKAQNEWSKARAYPPAVSYAAGPAVLGDGATDVQERYIPAYTTDLNHPDDEGWPVAMVTTKAAIQAVI